MPTTLRDKLWLWGHAAGSHNAGWNIETPSRMTPAEAAFYMNVPNLIMVRYNGQPATPYDTLARSFRPLKRVVWSIVGGAGHTDTTDRDAVYDVAARFPNITGVMMDDFFNAPETGKPLSSLTVDELREARQRLKIAGPHARNLDLWVVFYDFQTKLAVREHLELIDKLSFWVWDAKDLPRVEQSFDEAAALAPHAGRVLGCYMYDYGAKPAKPMTVDAMAKQCDNARRWLKEGRIEGIIFLATCICDLDIPAVEYAREWIAKHGDEQIG